MPVTTVANFIEALRPYPFLEPKQLAELTGPLQASFPDLRALARELVRRGWLTPHQINRLLQGRGKDLVLGSYVLLERLGEGGMGEVYKARNWKLRQIIALKLIRKERLANGDAVRRFHREIRAAAQLDHPNIVHALDAGEESGCHFFAMEYVDGIDLAKLLKQRGPLPVVQACDYIRQAALGLQHAFERGLVHRDIKPQNLLLTISRVPASGGRETAVGGTIKVLDMGLALVTHGSDCGEDSTTMTKEGAVMGTLDYIAPEQALDAHRADIRADLYSLGCTLYHLLAGRVPFPGGTATEKLLKHQLSEPDPLEQLRPDVSAEVSHVVRGLMAKHPDDRYQTPADTAAALASIGSGMFLAAGAGAKSSPRAHAGAQAGDAGPARAALAAPMAMPVDAGFNPPDDTVANWSSLVDSAASTADDTPKRQRRGVSKRHWVWICVAGAILMLGLVTLLIILIVQGRKQPKHTEEPKPGGTTTTKKDPAVIALENWIKKVAAMSADQQVEAVKAELKRRNRTFDGALKHMIENGAVTGLEFQTNEVIDITPLRALPALKRLSCSGSAPNAGKLTDLSPLKGLSLTQLNCQQNPVADLTPLKDMPLTSLELASTKVADLSPLKGMPLTNLNCAGTQIADLLPLKDMRLTRLLFNGTKVADLRPLAGMPLNELHCGGAQVTSLLPLSGMPLRSLSCNDNNQIADLKPLKGMSLTALNCNSTGVSDLSPLEKMPLTYLGCANTKIDDLMPLKDSPLTNLECGGTKVASLSPLNGKKLVSLTCNSTPIADVSPLKSMPLTGLNLDTTQVVDLTPLQGMPLVSLNFSNSKVKDLPVLKGMPLTTLNFNNTPIANLSPLAGLKLNTLGCSNTSVADLAPLKGMPLNSLTCAATKVSNLSPLAGMPLSTLHCQGTKVTDLTPLKGLPLTTLQCDYDPKRDKEILRSIKTLQQINSKPAADLLR
jgi:hypothetical protein